MIHDFEEWKEAVKAAHPDVAARLKFKGRLEHGLSTVSAEIPGLDRSFGVFTIEGEWGHGEVGTGIVLSKNKDNKMRIEAKTRLEATAPDTSKIKKGAFHRWLGKSEDSPITDADIKRGLASRDPHVRKMANFARNARKWKH
jgi:hypothetical protein